MRNDSRSDSGARVAIADRTASVLLLVATPGDRRVLAEALGRRYEVLDGGVEALSEPFDLCVIDITRLSEAWQRLDRRRQRERDFLLPVILLASAEHMEYATTLPAHVVDEVVLTPLRHQRLVERIELLLQRRRIELEVARERDEAMTSLARARDGLEERVRERTLEVERAAREARASQERYARVFNVVREGFAHYQGLKDEAGRLFDLRVLDINPAGAALSGKLREEQLGRTWSEIFPGFDPRLLANYRQAEETGQPVRFEDDNVLTNRWYDVTIQSIGREEFVATFFDITERHEYEEMLRQSELRFRSLVTASNDVVYRMSPDWSIMRQLQGQEFLSSTERDNPDWLQEYIPESDHPVVLAVIAEAIRTTGVFELEHRVNQADGSVGWTHSRAVPLRDEHGEITEWFGFASNVTERRRAEEALARQARLNEALTAIDHRIHSAVSAEEMLRQVVVDAAEALGCESSALDLREDARWVVRYVYRFPQEAVGRAFTDEEVPFAAMAARTQQPVVIDDAFADRRVEPEIQRAYNVRSVMVTPLVVRDEVIGAHFFNYHERFHTFTKAETDFARRLSSSLSLAITNARLYEAEHHVAETLQTAMLALPDHIPGIEFAHAYRSAAEAALVGGDFYDAFEMGPDLVGITVGDVAGKGLDASVLTSLAKNAIRAHASEKGATPSNILQLTNEVVFGETQGEGFVTVFFGVLDRRDGRFLYASAGHTTGALVAHDRTVTRLPSTGAVIGAFPGMRFDETEVRLGLDESLFLYTDGLTEARRDHELFGEERLFSLLENVRDGKPANTVRRVLEEVLRFAGGRLNDDLAVLAVRRLKSIEQAPRPERIEV